MVFGDFRCGALISRDDNWRFSPNQTGKSFLCVDYRRNPLARFHDAVPPFSYGQGKPTGNNVLGSFLVLRYE
jgi:hypothetical protein